MIEQTFYKGFEIRRHTFPYNGERRLLGYSVRRTLSDGTVVPYHRKATGKSGFHDTLFDTEQDTKQAIDTGDIEESRKKKRKSKELPLFGSTRASRLTRKPKRC